ncbi:hypothetical protein AYO39_01105 [Actinobacteria bacterium SCGC AG-212-D09]|nr:hypothetical protein AYO39_01105 [Actinobacteria bacterium SCGC AG-212-D09]
MTVPTSSPACWRTGQQLLVLTLAVAVVSGQSVVLLSQQFSALALPGPALVAPLSLVCVLLMHRFQPRRRISFDTETDAIVGAALALLGAWLLYWVPHRFGVQFWLWRPDLAAVALAALALAAFGGGTAFALYLALPVTAAAVAMSPELALILGHCVGGHVVDGVASGAIAAGPLYLAAPLTKPRAWVRVGAAIAGALLVSVAAYTAGLSLQVISILGALGALGATEALVLAAARRRDAARLRLAPIARSRIILLAGLAVALAPLDAAIPTFAATAAAPTAGVLRPGPELVGALALPGHVSTIAWRIPTRPEIASAAEAITTTGAGPASVLTYPLESLLRWLGSTCPGTSTLRIGGRQVAMTQYSDVKTGARWDVYRWVWRSARRFQRVTVVLSFGTRYGDVPLPSLMPVPMRDAFRTLGMFISNRQIVCQTGALERAGGSALVGRLMAGQMS